MLTNRAGKAGAVKLLLLNLEKGGLSLDETLFLIECACKYYSITPKPNTIANRPSS